MSVMDHGQERTNSEDREDAHSPTGFVVVGAMVQLLVQDSIPAPSKDERDAAITNALHEYVVQDRARLSDSIHRRGSPQTITTFYMDVLLVRDALPGELP